MPRVSIRAHSVDTHEQREAGNELLSLVERGRMVRSSLSLSLVWLVLLLTVNVIPRCVSIPRERGRGRTQIKRDRKSSLFIVCFNARDTHTGERPSSVALLRRIKARLSAIITLKAVILVD